MALPSEVNLKLITVGKSSILVMGTDQKFYWMGKNKHQLFKLTDENQEKFVEMQPACAPRLIEGKIIQIATGSKFTLFVTDKGKLFCRGKTFLDHIALPVL
jgi:alpha-tubulin suppressor-like RCC1 family protein